MKLEILEHIHLNDFMVISSLPDMGKVGGIVSSFLSKKLDTKNIANIEAIEKPWVSHFNGIVKPILDFYKIYFSEKYNIIIFTGDSQPQDSNELYSLCNIFLDYILSIGKIKCLYSAGGYLKQQVTGAPKVCGVTNNPELKSRLFNSGIELVGNEIGNITWFNGLILGLAWQRGIDAIGLFGEISKTDIKQPLAAKSIINAFSKLEEIRIDTKDLDKEYEDLMEDVYNKKETNNHNNNV